MRTIIMNNKDPTYKWSRKFHYGKEATSWFISQHPKGTIRRETHIMSKNQGQVGLDYDQRGAQILPKLNYKMVIADKSDGLTRTGQLLFQHSIQSYIWCVLGAQADTRWPIVGRGAMSLQSQEQFKKKVGSTLAQDDQVVALTNMRTAVKDTNVVLNMAITPEVILIPSNMIILDKMMVGYNNILKLAKKGMRFGKNNRVNYSNPVPTPTSPVAAPDNPVTYQSELYLLAVTLISGLLISKFII